MIHVGIKDGFTGDSALVTSRCQLVTAPLDYSKFYLANASVINTAFNLVVPKSGYRFVITDIVLSSDRGVGNDGAIVDLYEATGPDITTISTSIYQDEIAKQRSKILTGLNIIVSVGVWVNVKTDDNGVRANVAGYYITA